MLCSWGRTILLVIVVAIFPSSVVLGQDVTLHGKTFYKGNEPWVPKGLKVDTMPDRLALAVHPYLVKDAFVTQKQWHDQFGASGAQYSLIASEWNATPTNGCVDATTPALALSLVRYLQSLRVGLIGWAIDSNAGKLVKDQESFEPTDYASFKNCHDNSVSGGGKLLASYPHN